ncbi:MAG: heavy-metal-associated domain-containing protein [Planctomycetia bacterium]|nr:heavy-metal-associated domain-containing protein [Planctomycetia bacterium]
MTLAAHLAAKDPPPATTTITIQGMHCPACAKRVETKLQAVAGVASAQVNAETGIAVVTPAPRQQLSPRLLWEAVATASFKPLKLQGPNGTFTSKPKT